MELGDSGLTTVSSSDRNNNNVFEGIERISNVVKPVFSDMAKIKIDLSLWRLQGPGR